MLTHPISQKLFTRTGLISLIGPKPSAGNGRTAAFTLPHWERKPAGGSCQSVTHTLQARCVNLEFAFSACVWELRWGSMQVFCRETNNPVKGRWHCWALRCNTNRCWFTTSPSSVTTLKKVKLLRCVSVNFTLILPITTLHKQSDSTPKMMQPKLHRSNEKVTCQSPPRLVWTCCDGREDEWKQVWLQSQI